MNQRTDITAQAFVAACKHEPKCPPWGDPGHDAARVISEHPDQGWSLLCNGVVVFEDTGEILPDSHTVAVHRPEPLHVAGRAFSLHGPVAKWGPRDGAIWGEDRGAIWGHHDGAIWGETDGAIWGTA